MERLRMTIDKKHDDLPHRIRMYAINVNIYHQYTPVLLAYIPYMDPMGTGKKKEIVPFAGSKIIRG